ncbi:MAG: PAS domain S-box protein [Deltaproteobacteria bacterium]|nr:PAS domain S-box protein [Deltaproteobacteria bacterium]
MSKDTRQNDATITRRDTARLKAQLRGQVSQFVEATLVTARQAANDQDLQSMLSAIERLGQNLGQAIDAWQSHRSSKENLDRIQAIEERFRRIFHMIPDVVSLSSIDTGTYLDVNEGFTRTLGYEPDEVLGKSALDLNVWHDPNDRKRLSAALQRDGRIENEEFAFQAKDGTIVIGLMSATIIEIDHTKMLLAITRNITDRIETERELKHSKGRLEIFHRLDRAIIEARSLTDMIIATLDALSTFLPLTRVSLALFDEEAGTAKVHAHGIAQDTIGQGHLVRISQSFPDVEALQRGETVRIPEMPEQHGATMAQLRHMGIQSSINVPLVIHQELFGSLNVGYPVPNGYSDEDIEVVEEVANLLVIAWEQTRLHQEIARHAQILEKEVEARTAELKASNRELAQANEDLKTFASSVSHDLKAPLRAIKGFSEIIAERYKNMLPDKAQHYFDRIIEASTHMSRLIDDLLTYARLGRSALHFESVPLTSLVEDVQNILASKLDETQAKLEVAEDLAVVRADRNLLLRILVNLVDNATTYSFHDRPPHVFLSSRTEGDDVVVEVRDEGIGIDPKFHEKVFELFQRLQHQQEYPGTGVGLAIVQRCTDLLGGTVELHSQIGQGSTFQIRLKGANQ